MVCIAFILPKPILAKNIFGLHLTQTEDITKVSPLINSADANWGWVTIVIRNDQLDPNQWQDFFNHCRRLHLIPLIRLATQSNNGVWNKPSQSDIINFSTFLASLNWPTVQKHIILFNEVNRADEWQGQPNPQEYADTVVFAHHQFKQLDPNFFLISAGLDLAAPHQPPNYFGADQYYSQIIQYKPDFFHYLDGLSSHSYPNHGFIGKPTDTGRYSIKGYQWELSFLKNLGVNQTIPIFITETGWPHREGISANNDFYTSKTTAEFLLKAFNSWQQDDRIQAVTPFIYNYPQPPFDHFSWLDSNQDIYPSYEQFLNLPKGKNSPAQVNKYKIDKIHLPLIIFPNRQYQAKLSLKNIGQAIWSITETSFCLQPQTSQNVILSPICTDTNLTTLPNQSQTINFTFSLTTDFQPIQTIIGWQGIDDYFQIKPIIESVPIYRLHQNLLDKIRNFLKK